MKTKTLLSLLTAGLFAATASAQTILVTDFTGVSAAVSDTSIRLSDGDVTKWKGLNGQRVTVQTTGGNPDSYLSFDPDLVDNVEGRSSSGRWFEVGTGAGQLNLVTGTEYEVSFDYFAGVSDQYANPALTFGFQIFENNGNTAGFASSIKNTGASDDLIFAAENTSTADIAESMGAITYGSWVTHTSTQTLTLDADDSWVFIGFSNDGFTNTAVGADLRIDNVSLSVIPEPGTLALVGLSLGALLLFRRRR